MKSLFRSLLGLVLALALVPAALADTASCSPAPCITTTGLDFSILVPEAVVLRVGDAASVSTLVFDTNGFAPGFVVAGTGGDLGAGTVTVEVTSNAGNDLDLQQLAAGAEFAGVGDPTEIIPIGEISCVSTGDLACVGGDGPLPLGGAASAIDIFALGLPVSLNATWQYTYANTTQRKADTYAGTLTYRLNSQ